MNRTRRVRKFFAVFQMVLGVVALLPLLYLWMTSLAPGSALEQFGNAVAEKLYFLDQGLVGMVVFLGPLAGFIAMLMLFIHGLDAWTKVNSTQY